MTDKTESEEVAPVKIEYDTPIEVSKEQYQVLSTQFCGIVAHREEGGKYYIKVWVKGFIPQIEDFLKIKK